MKKYEYRRIYISYISQFDYDKKFSDLGSEGFELVSISDGYAYFKREMTPMTDPNLMQLNEVVTTEDAAPSCSTGMCNLNEVDNSQNTEKLDESESQ